MAERLDRERAAQVGRDLALRERREHCGIVRGIDDHGHALVILGGRAEHRGAADVDVLDRLLFRAPGPRDRRLERIEVDREHIDRIDRVLGERRVVDAAPREQAAVHARMQRLDAAVHDLRELGDRRNFDDGNSRVAQRLRGAAGRHDLETGLDEPGRERREALLVGDAEQRAPLAPRRAGAAAL